MAAANGIRDGISGSRALDLGKRLEGEEFEEEESFEGEEAAAGVVAGLANRCEGLSLAGGIEGGGFKLAGLDGGGGGRQSVAGRGSGNDWVFPTGCGVAGGGGSGGLLPIVWLGIGDGEVGRRWGSGLSQMEVGRWGGFGWSCGRVTRWIWVWQNSKMVRVWWLGMLLWYDDCGGYGGIAEGSLGGGGKREVGGMVACCRREMSYGLGDIGEGGLGGICVLLEVIVVAVPCLRIWMWLEDGSVRRIGWTLMWFHLTEE